MLGSLVILHLTSVFCQHSSGSIQRGAGLHVNGWEGRKSCVCVCVCVNWRAVPVRETYRRPATRNFKVILLQRGQNAKNLLCVTWRNWTGSKNWEI